MEQVNSQINSELDSLKVAVDVKLDEVAGKIPNFDFQLDTISNRAAETSRQMVRKKRPKCTQHL